MRQCWRHSTTVGSFKARARTKYYLNLCGRRALVSGRFYEVHALIHGWRRLITTRPVPYNLVVYSWVTLLHKPGMQETSTVPVRSRLGAFRAQSTC